MDRKIKTMREAQKLVKDFAKQKEWKDFPNINTAKQLNNFYIIKVVCYI